jgi:HNH endonuclease
MVRKKYVGKTCVYCGRAGASDTRDHVVAKEFFLKEDRGNLPQVPACLECNGKKAKLEHYLLSVLPLGSRRPDARLYYADCAEADCNVPPASAAVSMATA